jgi:hypothetical protein
MLNTSGRFSAQHAGSDSNTQPADLESAALPIELPASRHRASPPIYLFPLDLVQRVLAKTRAVLLHPRLHLLVNTALDTNARAVIQITTLRALEPDVFAITRLLGHWHIPPFAGVPPRRCVRRGNGNRRETKAAHKGLPSTTRESWSRRRNRRCDHLRGRRSEDLRSWRWTCQGRQSS